MPYEPLRHGPRRIVGPGFHASVYERVRQIPPGMVTTYGDLAAALGKRSVARHVGFAMAALPAGAAVPWWRVVAAGGKLTVASAATRSRQARLLAQEGLRVVKGRVQDFATRRFLFSS